MQGRLASALTPRLPSSASSSSSAAAAAVFVGSGLQRARPPDKVRHSYSSLTTIPVLFGSRKQNNDYSSNTTTTTNNNSNKETDMDVNKLFTRASSSSSSASSSSTPTPSWAYTPYNSSSSNRTGTQTKRNDNYNQQQSTWKIPNTIVIPKDVLEINFVRSSGAGGQNVNKVNTKVEVRIDLRSILVSSWLPDEVRVRLQQQQANRINKNGILALTSQENRTQAMNKKTAIDKLKAMILQAYTRPKIRKQRPIGSTSKATKRKNVEYKRKRSQTKQNRKRVDKRDW